MLTNRIGTFFIVIGLGLIGMFILSDIAKTPSCNLLLFGGISLAVGILLSRQNPGPPPKETGRFRVLHGSGKKQGKK